MASEAYKSLAPEDKAAAFNLIGNTQLFIGGIIVLIIVLIAFGKWLTFGLIIVAFAGYMYLKSQPGRVDSLQAYQKKYDATLTPGSPTPASPTPA